MASLPSLVKPTHLNGLWSIYVVECWAKCRGCSSMFSEIVFKKQFLGTTKSNSQLFSETILCLETQIWKTFFSQLFLCKGIVHLFTMQMFPKNSPYFQSFFKKHLETPQVCFKKQPSFKTNSQKHVFSQKNHLWWFFFFFKVIQLFSVLKNIKLFSRTVPKWTNKFLSYVSGLSWTSGLFHSK